MERHGFGYHAPTIIESNGELHRFLYGTVGSEEALSIILLLHERRERGWTAGEIRSNLNIEMDASASTSSVVTKRIELRLGDLFDRGLVRQDPSTRAFRLAPADVRHAHFIEQLCANAEDRDQARKLIYIKPLSSAAAFAAAFGARRMER